MMSLTLLFACARLLGVLFHMVPGLTRRGVFFGVTVPPEFRETAEARRLVRRYHAWVRRW